MNTETIIRFVMLALASFTVSHGVLAQGPLTPPGAPAPTMKTLDQIEPRTDVATLPGSATFEHIISQPGSYYLSRTLSTAKTTCVSIAVADVTLDLNGFSITRSGGSGGNGISMPATAHRVTIRNGTIVGDFALGINCPTGVKGTLVEDVAVSGCTSNGITVREGAVVRGCRVHDQAGGGIQAGPAATVSHCTVSNCQSGRGILGLFATSVSNCSVSQHTGFVGIEMQSGGIITDCAVYNGTFTAAAIDCETGCTISRSTAHNNDTPAGIVIGQGGTASHCAARGNTSAAAASAGISAAIGSAVIGCSAEGNLSTAGTLTGSTGAGISAATGVSILDCTVRLNRGDGIQVVNSCHVRGNHCASNGNGGDGAGIHATSDNHRIEGNTVTSNDRGIDVDAAGNFIVRNTASGNTPNYEIAAGNAVGTIVATPASLAISGSTGGAGVGSTDPWANFSF